MMATMYPPGMIGVPVSENARYSDFLMSVVGLIKPAGTLFKKQGGLGTAMPLNIIGEEFLRRPQLEWLFLTNDDNLCPPNSILQLLDHNVDAVTGLYLAKFHPFEPLVFDRLVKAPAGRQEAHDVSDRWYGKMGLTPKLHGKVKVKACGDGCLLIRRKVLETIPYPWWEYGETIRGACDHDMVFSRKMIEAGFDIWCDTDLWVDHIGIVAIRPYRDENGAWWVKLVQGEGREVKIPAAGWEEIKNLRVVK